MALRSSVRWREPCLNWTICVRCSQRPRPSLCVSQDWSPKPGAADLAGAWDDEAWASLTSWLDEAIGSGVSIEGGALRLDADATTVKVRDGQLIVTDGPYAETK